MFRLPNERFSMSTTACSSAHTQQLSTQALESDFGPSGNIVVDDVPGSNISSSNLVVGINDPVNRTGTDGSDTLTGTTSLDTLEGAAGNDSLDGLGAADSLYGNQGDDIIIGNDGNDLAFGGKDNDTVEGNQGNDSLFGNFGQDSLLGGAGNDSLHGGQGNDTLIGGQGNDDLNGGLGDDRFVYAAGTTGEDHIFGFQGAGVAGGDVVQIAASLLNGASITSFLLVDGHSTILHLSNGLEIEFEQVTGLTADDFVIV